jgi:twinkle protein
VIIVEGEMDKLSLNAVGYWNVVSVPSGTATARLPDKPLPSPQLDRQFRYVYNCWDLLENAKKVILATDNDAPGVALAEELARRIGKEKCWSVAWPSRRQDHPQLSPAAPATDDGGSEPAEQAEAAGGAWLMSAAADMPAAPVVGADPEWFRKDANEVLVKDGPQALRAFIEAAQPVPVQGLYTFQDFWKPVRSDGEQAAGSRREGLKAELCSCVGGIRRMTVGDDCATAAARGRCRVICMPCCITGTASSSNVSFCKLCTLHIWWRD